MPRQTADGTTYSRNTPPIHWGEPKYQLADCRCGGSQKQKEVYTLYAGAGNFGAWFVTCKKCGRKVSDPIELNAVNRWNRGEY